MDDIAITASGLAKKYRIGASKSHGLLGESIWNAITGPFGRKQDVDDERDFWALRDVSFDVPRGSVLGVIGRNGAGKSTLLKILTRITTPTLGRAELRGRVGSLLEVGTGFHQELTGRENVLLSGAILGMKRAEILRKFDEIVAFADIGQFIDVPVKRYSSGMKVRLGFAVAAFLEPEILLIDEVLAVGDSDFQKKCLGKMRDVASTGRTVILVSHQMRSVEELCQRVVVLDRGRVAFDGETADGVANYLQQAATFVPDSDANARPGSGHLRITEVSVPRTNLAVEEPKRIRFRIEQFDTATDRCWVTAIFRNSEGVPVAHCESLQVGMWYSALDGPLEGEVSLRSPWLHPGDYIVDLALQNYGMIDQFDGACRFSVRPGYPYRAGAWDEAARRDLVPPDFDFDMQGASVGADALESPDRST